MKKLYSTPDYKESQARRIRKSLKREAAKARRRTSREPFRELVRSPRGRRERDFLAGKTVVVVPEHFSIRENLQEMLHLFSEVHGHVTKRRPIFLNMSGIKRISGDAILYMLSVFHYYRKAKGFQSFSGNYPADAECRALLAGSGFLDFVHPLVAVDKQPLDILTVKSDSHVQGPIAKAVIDFANSNLNGEHRQNSRSLYATLIECMANTRHHAYSGNTTLGKWWLIAIHDKRRNRVDFTFLDNGLGIPSTIKQNFRERFLDPLLKKKADAELIFSALNGEFRTRTGEGWRGKGLPKIFEFVRNGHIDNFSIISRHGAVTNNGKSINQSPRKFYGTMLSWEFVHQKEAA